MAVVNFGDPDIAEKAVAVRNDGKVPEKCSFCARPLGQFAVYWGLSWDHNLVLHSECARTLALELLYDGRRCSAVENGQRLNSGVQFDPEAVPAWSAE